MWCCFTGLVFPFISMAPCYVPQDPNLQQHHCGNFACCMIPVFPTNHCYVSDKLHGIITQERVNNNVLHCVKFTFFINTSTHIMACLLHALFRPVVWRRGFWTLRQRVQFWICVLHRGWKQHILQPAWKTKGNVIYLSSCISLYTLLMHCSICMWLILTTDLVCHFSINMSIGWIHLAHVRCRVNWHAVKKNGNDP